MDGHLDNRSFRTEGAPEKFVDPEVTAAGEVRARVRLGDLRTLWFNTGTLCNITCANCYIESSPRNDRLSYLTMPDVLPFFEEIEREGYDVEEIGLTGGEPFMNPHATEIIEDSLVRGFSVLVLTNAMQPMMRPFVRKNLVRLSEVYGPRLSFRVSLDHYTEELHDKERGAGSWDAVWRGLAWLSENRFDFSVAGRTCWGESEMAARQGYDIGFSRNGINVDAFDPARLVLFPEMDVAVDVPEITESCWKVLGKDPTSLMCASSRMIVKRKGQDFATVVPCTLLPYEEAFDLGRSLKESAVSVPLNHPHCAKFCVLGGGSCGQS